MEVQYSLCTIERPPPELPRDAATVFTKLPKCSVQCTSTIADKPQGNAQGAFGNERAHAWVAKRAM